MTSSWYFVLYSNSVYMYFALFTKADKFALPNRLAWVLFLARTRLLHSSQNAFYITFSKELAKLLYLSNRSMRRMTHTVSWDSVQNLCLATKNLCLAQQVVYTCNLGCLKVHLFFLNGQWYKLWLKIAIMCFSNTRFTCKRISALYVWHFQSRQSLYTWNWFVVTATWNRSSPSFLWAVTSPLSTKTSVAYGA